MRASKIAHPTSQREGKKSRDGFEAWISLVNGSFWIKISMNNTGKWDTSDTCIVLLLKYLWNLPPTFHPYNELFFSEIDIISLLWNIMLLRCRNVLLQSLCEPLFINIGVCMSLFTPVWNQIELCFTSIVMVKVQKIKQKSR